MLDPLVTGIVSAAVAPCSFLIRFDFKSETKRVWLGFGGLRTLDGKEWDGLGELGSIEGLSGLMDVTAPAGKLVVSGVSPKFIAIARGEVDEFTGRSVGIFLQGFNLEGQCVSLPASLGLRRMTTMEVSRNAEVRSVAINHEGPYTGRGRAPGGYYSHADQQLRFPGDLAFEHMPYLLNKTITWPAY